MWFFEVAILEITIRFFKFVWEILPMQPAIQTQGENPHPPFFSKGRTFFKNRPPWYKFYSNSPLYHGGRFLTHPKTKKVFFSLGFPLRSVGAGKLFVLDFPMQPGLIYSRYKLAIFKCPIRCQKFSMALVLCCILNPFSRRFVCA